MSFGADSSTGNASILIKHREKDGDEENAFQGRFSLHPERLVIKTDYPAYAIEQAGGGNLYALVWHESPDKDPELLMWANNAAWGDDFGEMMRFADNFAQSVKGEWAGSTVLCIDQDLSISAMQGCKRYSQLLCAIRRRALRC